MAQLKQSFPELIPAPVEQIKEHTPQIFDKEKQTDRLFNYPLKPLTFSARKPTTNVLFIVLESWQAAMLTADVMPNMSMFAGQNYRFNNHLSGGSVTVPGLFSLMYGLHPSYLKYAQAAPYEYQTVLTKSLQQQDYVIEAYVSTNLERFSLKPMFFGDIKPENYTYENASNTETNDRKVVNKLIQSFAHSDNNQPWFKFVFLNSSHHSYSYPPEFAKFTPVPDNSEGFLFNKNMDPVPFRNDYKNALYYLDTLFAEIEQSLKEQQLDENTIIMITGDHAEEFNENERGYWGHGSNFTRYQTHVPLLLHVPGKTEAVEINTRSSHIDIVPTILTHLLGCDNTMSDYSSGENLFDLPLSRGLIQASYKDKAYLIDDTVYATGVSVSSYDINDIKLENRDYQFRLINQLKYAESKFLH